MSLLINSQPTQPTDQERLTALAKRIKESIPEAYTTLSRIQKHGIDSVWSNPRFTPQEIIDALGDSALPIFKYHGELTTLIESIAESEQTVADVKYPKNAFTINATTGKITVTNQPYQKL
jgi:hypothetical protein